MLWDLQNCPGPYLDGKPGHSIDEMACIFTDEVAATLEVEQVTGVKSESTISPLCKSVRAFVVRKYFLTLVER